MSPGTDVKVLGTALGVGILIDATIVRALLVPALVSVFGRWNWWLPTWLARILVVEPSPLAPSRSPATDRHLRRRSRSRSLSAPPETAMRQETAALTSSVTLFSTAGLQSRSA